MNTQSQNPVNQPPDRVQLVQELIKKLAAASKQGGSPDAFYRQVLDELQELDDLKAILVWIVTPDGVRLIGTAPQQTADSTAKLQQARGKSYDHFLRSAQAITEELNSADLRFKLVQNNNVELESTFQCHSSRLLHDGDRAIVLEMIAESTVDLQSPLIESLVGAVREIAEDFHRNFELERLRKTQQTNASLVSFSQRLLQANQSQALEFEIVNSAVDILDIDRASLLIHQGNHNNVVAVSGVSSLNQHSESIQSIQDYASKGMEAGLPAQIRDEQSSTTITVLELGSSANDSQSTRQPSQRILVLEDFDSDAAAIDSPDNLAKFVELVTAAIQRDVHLQTGGVLPQVFKSPKAKWILGFVILFVLVLCFVPAKLRVRAEGQIIPKTERGIFAPTDGEVIDVKVQHNELVNPGEVLVVIRSPDLELKLTELRGQQQATAEKIRAIEAQYAKGNDASNSRPEDSFQDSSIKELEILQASQLKQLAILEALEKSLSIQSPVKGRVVTWQLNQLLKGRQIKQGQLLLSVAVEDDGWLAEIEIRDDRFGHVLSKIKTDSNPESECMLVSAPDQRYSGKLISVAGTTSINQDRQPVVNAIAQYDFPQESGMRSGAKVIATVDCGTRSLGYVYFHEFYHSVLSYLF